MLENNHENTHQPPIGGKNDYLYRVSLKGLIVNKTGELLVVKEAGRTYWDLPGGGMNHGETIKQALAREMYEEVGLTENFQYQVVCVEDPILLKRADIQMLRIILLVKTTQTTFTEGEDADAVSFIPPSVLQNSESEVEQKAFEHYQNAARWI